MKSKPEPSILMIDDDEANVMVTTALLEDEGYAVVDVGSISAAQAHLTGCAQQYDVILLDRHLPDGLSVPLVPMIRRAQPEAKIVLVSGEVAGCTDYPVDGYFAKGDAFEVLLTMIQGLTASAESFRRPSSQTPLPRT